MIDVVLKNGEVIKAYHTKRSKSGKNYKVTTRICDCYRNTCDCIIEELIQTNDIATIDGKEVEPYIAKSVKYKHSRYKVTKVWEHGGHKWFKVSGSAGGGKFHYKIIGKGQLEEYTFFKSSQRELEAGMPYITCRKEKKLSIPIEVLRDIYKAYMDNR